MIKSRRIGRTKNLAGMGRRGMHAGFLWENQNEVDHQKDLEINGRINL
jgi:hypothetical protein